MLVLALGALPRAHLVAGRIAEQRHPDVALEVFRSDDRTAVRHDAADHFIDYTDINLGHDAGIAGDGVVAHEVSDHLTAAIFEAATV